MELKSRNVQHARNLFDRAVTLLPRVDQLWYKYVYLEELLRNIPGVRQVFERWMKWEPDDKAWQAYIKLEDRFQEFDRESALYERWVAVRPEPRVWVKWAKFEEDRGRVDKAREVFQTALEFFGDDEEQVERAQSVFSAFAKMETRLKEFDRARVIYKVRLYFYLFRTLKRFAISLHFPVFHDQRQPACTPPTPSSRSSLEPKRPLNPRFLPSAVSNTRRK
jgi:crooked neck